jgi:preprotein translocase subunit SecE
MKEKIINFVNDVIKEMKKVTWPTQNELKESTMIVIVLVIVLAVFTFVVDGILNQISSALF